MAITQQYHYHELKPKLCDLQSVWEIPTYVHTLVNWFMTYFFSILICVEWVHEHKWDVYVVCLVQILNLLHSHVQKCKIVSHLWNAYKHRHQYLKLSSSDYRQSKIAIFCNLSSIKSNQVIKNPLTVITDLGPLQPMEVPKPPFNLTTTNFDNIFWISDASGAGSDL